MKFVNFLVTISIFSLFKLSFATNYIPISSSFDENLSESVCEITNDIIRSKSDVQDVLVSNLGGKDWSSTINDIIQCLSKDSVVVISDFTAKITEKNLWKISVVILLGFDQDNHKIMSKVLLNSQPPSIYTHLIKFICILNNSSSQSQRVETLTKFSIFGIINIALVHKTSNGDIIYETLNAQCSFLTTLANPSLSIRVFPDKLKNLTGFQYQIAALDYPPSVVSSKKFISSHMLHFLRALETVQNAKFRINFYDNFTTLHNDWINRKFHLCLSTSSIFKASDPKLMNYDKKSYCALVPLRSKSSLKIPIFFKPFDGFIWMLFVVSVVGSVGVWRMFCGRGAVDSHWKLAVGIFMMFIGQGAEFSRQNRFVLAFLLNIICLCVFLLSNLYEGAITSYMIEPTRENRLETINDLATSDFHIKSTKSFVNLYRNLSFFTALESRLNATDVKIQREDIIDQKYVFIRVCEDAEKLLNIRIKKDRLISDYYYILREELTWRYLQLEASYLNPFIERFQYYMDLSFQAGLPHMWKIFEYRSFRYKSQSNHDFVELKDLILVFRILVLGLFLTFFVLLIEIFYHDCIAELNVYQQLLKLLKWYRSNQYTKVKKITVRPCEACQR